MTEVMAALKHIRNRSGACASPTLTDGTTPNPVYLKKDNGSENGVYVWGCVG